MSRKLIRNSVSRTAGRSNRKTPAMSSLQGDFAPGGNRVRAAGDDGLRRLADAEQIAGDRRHGDAEEDGAAHVPAHQHDRQDEAGDRQLHLDGRGSRRS